MKKIISGIYKITSPSCRIYIGQSIDIAERWNAYNMLNCKFQRLLYKSFKKYGVKNHQFEIIEECAEDMLNEREIYYIKFFNSFNVHNGLNLTEGGNSSKKSDNHRKRISDSHKKWWKNNHRTQTEEQKQNSSKAQQEYWKNASKEDRLKRGDYSRNTNLTEERKRQIGENNKEWWASNTVVFTDERRKKVSENSKLHWEKNRDAMIAAQTGKTRTDEQKKNYSRAAKKKWEDNPNLTIHTPEMNRRLSEKMSGDKNPMFGRSHNEETRKLMRDKQKEYNERVRQERLMMIF